MRSSWLALLVVVFGSTSASAEIIVLQSGEFAFQYGDPYSAVVIASPGMPMSTIVITQPLAPSSPMVQRAHAWSLYQKSNKASGSALILQPYTGTESDAQMSVNRNISRAHRFRLNN
jgi:hypothetical protein